MVSPLSASLALSTFPPGEGKDSLQGAGSGLDWTARVLTCPGFLAPFPGATSIAGVTSEAEKDVSTRQKTGVDKETFKYHLHPLNNVRLKQKKTLFMHSSEFNGTVMKSQN